MRGTPARSAPGKLIPAALPSAKRTSHAPERRKDLRPITHCGGDGRPLWARWTVATTVGETVGFAVPAAVGALAYGLSVPDTATVPLAVAAGGGEGAILGFAQSRVLGRELAGFRPRDWVAATAAAAGLGWAVGMTFGVYGASLPAALLIVGAIVGAIRCCRGHGTGAGSPVAGSA